LRGAGLSHKRIVSEGAAKRAGLLIGMEPKPVRNETETWINFNSFANSFWPKFRLRKT
jgi:hypothetical protein